MRPLIQKVRSREFIGALIKPCKKCGFEVPFVETEYLSNWQVFCHSECDARGPKASEMEIAIEEWNKLQDM